MHHDAPLSAEPVVNRPLGRRELLVRTAPACALACFGLSGAADLLARELPCAAQDPHKFDVKLSRDLSSRDMTRVQNQGFIRFIGTLRREIGDDETIRLLNANSEAIGRQAGESQASRFPDTSFKTFTDQFRPPNYASSLTHEVVEDTEHAVGLRVTECVWAAVFTEAGLRGEIGHAAVCNMDYYWPPAFNPAIAMERDKTLMQGHDCCNHRYVEKV